MRFILFILFCTIKSTLVISQDINPQGEPIKCNAPVVLDAQTNVFRNYALHSHSAWRNATLKAAESIEDSTKKRRALRAAAQGVFVWIENPEDVYLLEELTKDIPCNEVLGVVLSGLSRIDCPENNMPNVTALPSYESLFLNPVVRIIRENPTVGFVVIVEPGVIGKVVKFANVNTTSCDNVRQSWRQNIPITLRSLELPNVITYMDAAHGGWLGWKEVQREGAMEIANTWKNAGQLKQFCGLAVNVASYNAWHAIPSAPWSKADWNPARNEQRYLNILRKNIRALNVTMPLFGIVDTSRAGVQGIRRRWLDWCNVKYAGFGPLFNTNTKDSNVDALLWVKNGGFSDGSSVVNLRTDGSNCGGEDAFKPMPARGDFSQAYFEMLLENSKPGMVRREMVRLCA
ncbi:glycoside hydrolase family 6 protein [Periconia macrospinosa]|uniref:Glucanase n=1 Tax=Periconia macrospinosa TaxID=97972 RepID=A0A2V1DEA3_9PLEO|nr:glycoside hydrolase family 6 protein [Periconia macrospinosa]